MFITSTMDWKENYIFKRKLYQEASEKLKQLPLCNRPNPVFVTEWVDDGRQIVGIGCAFGTLLTVRIEPIIEPGLFVTTKDWKLLNTVLSAKGSDYKLKRFSFPLMFAANDFRVDEVMLDPSVAVKSELVKIETGTFSNARKILTVFTEDENSYRYVSVPHYWDATKQVLFELAIMRQEINRGKNISNDYFLPRVTHRWFDDRLRILKIPPPNIPIITFDIKTVSSDRDRIPTGEDCDDVIFSAAVYHSHENILYSQVYLPIRGRDEESLLNEMKTMDKYPEYKNHKHLLQVFTCERDLLICLMKILSPGKGRLHYLVGFNSSSYHMPFVLKRCQFYGLEQIVNRFVWRYGYAFGYNQIHIDLYRLFSMRYDFSSYKLADVSRLLLKEMKKDVNAAALRYTFHRMREHQMLYPHRYKEEMFEASYINATDEPHVKRSKAMVNSKYPCGNKNETSIPSLYEAITCNDHDAMFLYRLLEETNAIEYLLEYAHGCRMPISLLNDAYNKMRIRIMSKCFVVGLERGIFLASFRSATYNPILPLATNKTCYMRDPSGEIVRLPTNHLIDRVDMETLVKRKKSDEYDRNNTSFLSRGVTDVRNPSEKCNPEGGANYCEGERYVVNSKNGRYLQVYDYVSAYPRMFDKKNISDETCCLIPASTLFLMFDCIFNRGSFQVYDFMNHSGLTKFETNILYHRYFYFNEFCGDEFPFEKHELRKRKELTVLIIWNGRRGVLSDIIASLNGTREQSKIKIKQLEGVLETLSTLRAEYLECQRTLEFVGIGPTTGMLQKTDSKTNGDDDNADFGCFVEGKISEDFESNITVDCRDKKEGTFEKMEVLSDDTIDIVTAAEKNHCVNTSILVSGMFTFKFEKEWNGIIRVYNNGTCEINRERLKQCADECSMQEEKNADKSFDTIAAQYRSLLTVLKSIESAVLMEKIELENEYSIHKKFILSVYGNTTPSIMGIVTFLTRITLIKAARYLIQNGCVLHYVDTDSLFVSNPKNEDFSNRLNNILPYMKIEMKVMRACAFVGPKTYLQLMEDDSFKYGKDKNGPLAWRYMVDFFTANPNPLRYDFDIQCAFDDFFDRIYTETKRELRMSEGVTSLNEATIVGDQKKMTLEWFTFEIMLKENYKQQSPTRDLRNYLSHNYPNLINHTRQRVFYYMALGDARRTELRPSVELEHPDFTTGYNRSRQSSSESWDHAYLEILRKLNLFKFFDRVFPTVFHIIRIRIEESNVPFRVKLNKETVRRDMFVSFLKKYEEHILLPYRKLQLSHSYYDFKSVNLSREEDIVRRDREESDTNE